MKLLASLLTILLLTQPTVPQTGRILLPTGGRQADQAVARADQNVPPPQQPKRVIDGVKLQQDADELAALAASIPPAVSQTNHGLMPKDMVDKLKRIEKLAKHLRGEINP
jgi:hypothetical protein